ncbi:MAG: 4-hydroxythreonine-4-phosphate dehydrogenase PdxA [Alphaproteobacteria bacterium]|nr:4-hydroxythreonine-4-phosphate dehydrogenase PdxA [Alphaproteobacteria bacterium]
MPPLAVTLGDPAGIGPEITGKAWAARHDQALPCFFAVGNEEAIRRVWAGPIAVISTPEDAHGVFGKALPLLPVADCGDAIPGAPDLETARCALDTLGLAVGLAQSGTASGLVTGPVSKSQLQAIGFTHPGQTEFVAERCGVAPGNVAMMLAGPDLRVIPITIHIPLADVPNVLTSELIISRGRTAAIGLQRNFGIQNPRIAVAGLNPHAGEQGMMGDEETRIIAPAIAALAAEGFDVFGPVSPDALFTPRARQGYDLALCMYHDQGLIPLKALCVDEGVNMSLGLPIIRTSPDHGTAFDIAGKNLADPGAMIAAIRMAGEAAAYRASEAA